MPRLQNTYLNSTIWKILSLPVIVSMLVSCSTPNYPPLPTVASVDLSRYQGKWFEVALIPNRFQSMCVADTQAEYKQDDDLIRVTNRCRKDDGSIEKANGVAKIVEGSNNAKLRVSFFRPFYGNYWVLALDPNYQWVLVGEPARQYGWVLSRTPQLDPSTLNKILDEAEKLGYTRSAFKTSAQTKPLID